MKIINENVLYDKKEHVIRKIICEKIEKTDTKNFVDRIEVPQGYRMYEMNILDTKRDGEEIEAVVMVTFENVEPVICYKYQNHNYPGKIYYKERTLRRWKNS